MNPSPHPQRRAYWLPVWALCITQLISWGTLYYTFSVLLSPIGAARGWTQAQMVGAFSLSLLLSGFAAYPAGKLIQKGWGRQVMAGGSILAAIALATVAWAPTLPVFYLAWALAGLAMAVTLYEAAFAVLAMAYEADYRRAVTTVTLSGGFASTVFWPLTERLNAWMGWQETLGVYIALHLAVCLPLHIFGLRHSAPKPSGDQPVSLATLWTNRQFLLLAGTFTLNTLLFAVISVHMIPLLQSRGATLQQAAWLAAAAGPMQVTGRLVEFLFGSRWRAAQTGTLAMLCMLPALVGLLLPNAPGAILLLSIGLYGISNGVMTIVRSLTVVELFGRENYGKVSGALAAPATLSRGLGPSLASLILLQFHNYNAVLVTLLLASLTALFLFQQAHRATPTPHRQ